VPRRSILRAALVVVAGLCAAAACSSDRGSLTAPAFGTGPSPTITDNVRPSDGEIRTVAMVGDSITLGARGPLADGLRSLGLDVRAIDAANGRRIVVGGPSRPSGADIVSVLGEDPPDLWVIALGTNDVFQYTHAEEYRAAIGALLSGIPATTPVVWVDTYLEDDPARSDVFNQALRETLEFRGTASVADWASVAPGDGVLSDGIHPSDEGAQQFGSVVTDAVSQWLG
jgi:lysophospholipase L1-like esterase